jgi:hypothetical protein
MTEPIPDTDDVTLLRALRAAPELFAAIASRPPAESEFQLQARLRRQFPETLVRAALTLHDLRRKPTAVEKFSRSDRMWFTATGLEQSTSEIVGRHKARRFERTVWDVCCGIGGDSLALAERCEVRSVDLDPAMCLRTQWNAEVYDVGERVRAEVGDAARLSAPESLLHIDPDRRPGGGSRRLRVEDASPDLETLRALMGRFRGGAIKLSPASNFGGKFPGCEIELISVNGECKEATVWFGELAGADQFRATLLPFHETIAGDPLSARAEVTPPQEFLFDPDPAIVRAGLLDLLAARLGLCRLDAEEEYLTASATSLSPWVQAFRVLEVVPNNDRAIRAACRRYDFGSAEIKCRHLSIAVEQVRRHLPLNGSRAGTLVFARASGKACVLVCERFAPERSTAADLTTDR